MVSLRLLHDDDWVDRAARAGLVAYGVVHLVIAWLALQLAFGDREGSASSQGAVRELAQQPFGEVLVGAIAVGMVLLAVWQGVEAGFGYRDEDGATRVRKRVTAAGKAVVYAAIAVSAGRVATGGGSGGSGGTDTWTARLMDLPGGRLLVGLVGLAVIGAGGYLVHKAWSKDFAKYLDADGRRGSSDTAYLWCGQAGYTAKGVTFGIVGVLFVVAAWRHRPHDSGGLDQALTTLVHQPLGPVLLAAVALGLAGFGLFCLARARHLAQ